MKKSKVLAMVTAAGLVSAISPLSALAAVVSEETPDASVQQQVTLEKTAEVVPTYTVDVPAQVEIGKDAVGFLPVLTLTIGMVAVLMRYARNTMLDVLNSDYIKTARSKGIPEWKVYLKHGFRNAMKPVLVILVFRIPMLVGGSVVIESVFSYPGIGLTMTNAIVSGDYPIVLVTTLIIAAAMLICSFMVDVFNALLDPRVRLGE